MASVLDVNGLTLNPEEIASIAEFIVQQRIERPDLAAVHDVQTEVRMDTQIGFASQFPKMGLRDQNCARPASGAVIEMTEKFWTPKKIGDTLVHCNADLDSLFKAYFTRVKAFADLYNIEGSDEAVFITLLLEDAIMSTVWRAAWFSDTSVAEATLTLPGLKVAGDSVFYDYGFDGIFEQIFTGVAADEIQRLVIPENAETVPADQLNLAEGRAEEILDGVLDNASIRLRQNADAQFNVSGKIFASLTRDLKKAKRVYDIEVVFGGLRVLTYDGRTIIDMESVWDYNLKNDFWGETTNETYFYPNRVVLTPKYNIPIGTLNEDDMSTISTWYNEDERLFKFAFGFTEDAKVLSEELISVAY